MNAAHLNPISPHIRRQTREWFRKAEHELAFRAVALLDEADPPMDTAWKNGQRMLAVLRLALDGKPYCPPFVSPS